MVAAKEMEIGSKQGKNVKVFATRMVSKIIPLSIFKKFTHKPHSTHMSAHDACFSLLNFNHWTVEAHMA